MSLDELDKLVRISHVLIGNRKQFGVMVKVPDC